MTPSRPFQTPSSSNGYGGGGTFLAALMLLTLSAAAPVPAIDMTLPPGCACYIASDHGVVPDDGLDDTEALRALIRTRFHERERYGSPPFIYLPAGTYNVSGPIEARREPDTWSDGWLAGFILVGQGREKTILRLDDTCPAFADPDAPVALLKTGSEGRDDNESGSGNQAFRHSIMNLTIHTGSGNPGVIALDYLANNRGAVEEVTIVSGDGGGKSGIAMNRAWPGPALIKNVLIDGFERGIEVDRHYDYSMTMEHVTLRNQSDYGMYVHNNNLFIRGLRSDNAATALRINGAHGYVVLLDAVFGGGSAGVPAVSNAGSLLARNVQSIGYDTVIAADSGPEHHLASKSDTTRIVEYTSHDVLSLFDGPKRTLNLPIKETPLYEQPDPGRWSSVVDHGASPDQSSDDDAPAIQAALDGDKDIVYLPCGDYAVGQTIVVRGGVRKILGMQSSISIKEGVTVEPLLRFEGGSPDGVILEHLRLTGSIEHASADPVTIRHCDHKGYANSAAGTGDFFVEDVIGKPYRILHPQHVWMRQVNTEFGDEPLIENHGGTLWILGHKSEGEPTLIKTVNGTTELLGGHFRALKPPAAETPAIIALESRVSLSFAMEYRPWPLRVVEERDGQRRELRDGPGRIVLYTGYAEGMGADPPSPHPRILTVKHGRNALPAALYDIRGRKLSVAMQRMKNRAPGVYLRCSQQGGRWWTRGLLCMEQ